MFALWTYLVPRWKFLLNPVLHKYLGCSFATNFSSYYGGFLFGGWVQLLISSSVSAIFSSVAKVRNRWLTTWRHVVKVVVFPLDGILVWALCFVSSLVMSTFEADFFMKNLNSQISLPSCIPLVSHDNLKLHRNPIIGLDSKVSKICDLMWAVTHFFILWMFFGTVSSCLVVPCSRL